MSLQNYYEKFYKVVWDIDPDSHPMWPTFNWTDGDEIMGLFAPAKSGEITVAAAQGHIRTVGQFSCDPNAPIDDKDQVRRASDGVFFRLTSDPEHVPQATTQFKLYQAEISDRPDGFVDKYDGDGNQI